MNITVIHHSADFDGLFCGEIARKFLPGARFIGWDFSDPPIKVPTLMEGTIYVLDLPIDKVFGFDYALSPRQPFVDPNTFVWIDHHKSSIDSHPKEIPGYRIDGVAACRLAWQWFEALTHVTKCRYNNPLTVLADDVRKGGVLLPTKQDYIDRKVEEPLAVRLAGEYDIWDKRDPRAEVFQFGLRSRELNDFDWNQILSAERPTIEEVERLVSVGHQGLIEPDGTCVPAIVAGLLQSGEILQRYQQRSDAGMMHRSFVVDFEGLKFLALTTARCNSLTFASKDVPETGHDALMGFHWNGKWNVSLYHAKHRTDIDLSKIAVKHGGGGHSGACGFQTDKLPFL